MSTSVANAKTDAFDPGTFVYIGRANGRYRFKASIWANPFTIGKDGNREQVINLYRDYMHGPHAAHLRPRLPELRDKRLVCWCHPLPCHGDVLVEMVEALE